MKKQGKQSSNLITGILLVLAGFFILAINLDLIAMHWWELLLHWQVWLILIGLSLIGYAESRVTGIIVFMVGALFLIPEFVYIPFSMSKLIVPTVLVLVGGGVILSGFGKRKKDEGN